MNGLWGLNSEQELLKVINAFDEVCSKINKSSTIMTLKDVKNVVERNYRVDAFSVYEQEIQNISDDISKNVEDLESIINKMKAGM